MLKLPNRGVWYKHIPSPCMGLKSIDFITGVPSGIGFVLDYPLTSKVFHAIPLQSRLHQPKSPSRIYRETRDYTVPSSLSRMARANVQGVFSDFLDSHFIVASKEIEISSPLKTSVNNQGIPELSVIYHKQIRQGSELP